jgi:DnaJ-class molecular chaperone
MVNAAFRGFKALPEAIIVGAGTARAWHEVLEVSPSCSLPVAEAAFKRLARLKHPDGGGSDREFIELKTAWEQAKEILS